ncbi:MAG: hypothetical protein LUI02_00945 [Clostridiales bacterium]|nr:hypothetical protein [Clostridiales bacterium]
MGLLKRMKDWRDHHGDSPAAHGNHPYGNDPAEGVHGRGSVAHGALPHGNGHSAYEARLLAELNLRLLADFGLPEDGREGMLWVDEVRATPLPPSVKTHKSRRAKLWNLTKILAHREKNTKKY